MIWFHDGDCYQLKWQGFQYRDLAIFFWDYPWYQEFWVGLEVHWRGKIVCDLPLFSANWIFRWRYKCEFCGKRGNRCNCDDEISELTRDPNEDDDF